MSVGETAIIRERRRGGKEGGWGREGGEERGEQGVT